MNVKLTIALVYLALEVMAAWYYAGSRKPILVTAGSAVLSTIFGLTMAWYIISLQP